MLAARPWRELKDQILRVALVCYNVLLRIKAKARARESRPAARRGRGCGGVAPPIDKYIPIRSHVLD